MLHIAIRRPATSVLWGIVIWGFLLVTPGVAGQTETSDAVVNSIPISLPQERGGPPVPVLPNVISRDESGGITVRAVRVTSPIRIDGRLDERVYETLIPASDFIQLEPYPDTPATEKTDVWVLFDNENVYVTFRCWETQPERLVGNDMRRDNPIAFTGNDAIGIALDTFDDRRNGVIFTVNPVGGRNDLQFTNEGQVNLDWNPVWDTATELFEGGWAVEIAIPFKSLRYRPERSQVWGFNAARNNRAKSEWSYLSPLPASRTGPRGLTSASVAATLVGIEAPPASLNLEIKPYTTGDLTTDVTSTPGRFNDISADAGIDVKYGVTQNLTADFTYNTDFAQVEVDEAQINLTRFSLFFPEKREFFLENRGTFGFGLGGDAGRFGDGGDTPLLFYSRRIGLSGSQKVPIQAGGRLSGRVGRFNLGLLNIQTADDSISGSPGTNFSVVRVRRDILRRSSIGAMFTGRSTSLAHTGSNEAYGVDATLAFFDNLSIDGFWARTRTDGFTGDETSYRAKLDYDADRYGIQLEHLLVGDAFNPEVGFVRRDDMRRSFAEFRFSPRPSSFESVRKFSWLGSMAYIENIAGRVEGREFQGEFAVEFQNSDRFSVGYDATYEFLPRPFRIARGVTLPVGGYDFGTARVGWAFGQQRPVFGNLSFEHGSFYNGRKTAVGFSRGRVELTRQLSVQPSLSLNWLDLDEGKFQATVIGSRVIYTVTPLMFVGALVQYNSASDTVGLNVRLRWEYVPGSELFVVYNEQRDTLSPRFPGLENRAFVIKINRLFRF